MGISSVKVLGCLAIGTCVALFIVYFSPPLTKNEGHSGSDDINPDINRLNTKGMDRKHGVKHFTQSIWTEAPAPQCNYTSDPGERFDCHPDTGASQTSCEQRGCCWKPQTNRGRHRQIGKSIGVPSCFFPSNYPSYVMNDYPVETPTGLKANLTKVGKSPWPNDIQTLQMELFYEERQRFHMKITDANHPRYEVPIDTPQVSKMAEPLDYFVRIIQEPFSIEITRETTGTILFDSTILEAPLIYTDQFLQMSTKISSTILYGLGEQMAPLLYNFTSWHQINMWARDAGPQVGDNLYGVHPFYMVIEEDGNAHGVLFLNSNGMDIDLQPFPAATFRTIGGILDFYIFTGPSPDDVIRQYLDVIGTPLMPPYWALGFHLCRYGYKTAKDLNDTINRNRAIGIPYDTQWTDIDYMSGFKDWTLDENSFKELPAIVKDLHDHGQHYIIIVDPGISNSQPAGSYPPFEKGMSMDIFIKAANGKPLEGKVWPGSTYYPDFTHPSAVDWWYDSINTFHQTLPFDSLWTDMNEPSNFVMGSTSGCTNSSLDKPPYTPGIADSSLLTKTICASAVQHLSTHYNLHNMYGHFEVKATRKALDKLYGSKRSIIISRSTFVSTGKYGGHWTGDISSTWDYLYYSIPSVLRFNMFGIPLVGADVCGFGRDTTEELCTRWMQLGAFYPFMRNHNALGNKDQDPASFSPTAQANMRSALQLRYSLLPFLYTLFSTNSMVARPLSFQFPEDKNTYSIDKQFMWGKALLISPVLIQGATSVSAYFPKDTWYNYQTGEDVNNTGQYIDLSAPLDTINVHVRGGSIIPTQPPEVTTTKARVLTFGLNVALNATGYATGDLHWDDGETRTSAESYLYNRLRFEAYQNQLVSTPLTHGYHPAEGMYLDTVRVMGVKTAPTQVTVNGKNVKFAYNAKNKVLEAKQFAKVSLLQSVTVKW